MPVEEIDRPGPAPADNDRTWDTPLLAVNVAGLGIALPVRDVPNQELVDRLDTSDAWIVGRTGIASRRISGPGETTTDLATRAAERALADAGVKPHEIDLVVVATSTPDSPCPSTAARVGAALGLRAGGFDINGACCGFVHGMLAAAALVSATPAHTALVVGADRYNTLTDPDDRASAILFGDGAGAMVLTGAAPRPGAPGILGSDLGGAPDGVEVIEVPVGHRYLAMDGPDLFRRATRALTASASAALGRAGAGPDDVDLFVPHQANARIIGAAAERIGIPHERVVVDLALRANTSAASIPLALHTATSEGRLGHGDRVLISSIGAGLTWASAYLR